MKKYVKIPMIIILILCIFTLTGCESEDDTKVLEEKNVAELDYLESNILVIVKNYLSGNYLDENNQTDWDMIKDDFSNISNSSSIIVIDLASLKIDNNKILELETKTNDVSVAIDSKSESNFIGNISLLYKLVPEYLDEYYDDKNCIKEKQIRGYLLDSIYHSIISDYTSANTDITNAENIYLELSKDENYIKENANIINREYVILQEYKLSLQNKNIATIIEKYLDTFKYF